LLHPTGEARGQKFRVVDSNSSILRRISVKLIQNFERIFKKRI
jgi:hypothetical protein